MWSVVIARFSAASPGETSVEPPVFYGFCSVRDFLKGLSFFLIQDQSCRRTWQLTDLKRSQAQVIFNSLGQQKAC